MTISIDYVTLIITTENIVSFVVRILRKFILLSLKFLSASREI